MDNWYLLYTRASGEMEAARTLTSLAERLKQNIEVFLPLVKERRSKGLYRFRTVEAPLFPRYLFARLDFEHVSAVSIRSSRGVQSIVTFGDQPATVPCCMIEEIRSRIVDGYVKLEEAPPPDCPFMQGERVEIRTGAFSGLTGVFLSYVPSKQRAMILLDCLLLGRNKPVPIPVSNLSPLCFADVL
ncbi:MAG: transcription termination/antitermination NusG family protein [Acidobacteriota bacterium]